MGKDIDDTLDELNETMDTMDEMIDNSMDDANTALKKGIVQIVVLIIITLVIYFIWGTTWYFWVSFSIALFSALAIGASGIFLYKTKNKMAAK
ncbi:MAG TPA: hypothetical protein EYG74_00935 [Sulfurimonas autotrophica]|nr:hypothetical protein [Sulfurimonas autotrophica]